MAEVTADRQTSVGAHADAGGRLWPAAVTVVAFATLPYASLVAANVGEHLDLEVVLGWWAVTVVGGLVLFTVATRVAGRQAARHVAALTGVALFVFFNYPLFTAVDVPVPPLARWAVLATAVFAVAVPLTRRQRVQRFLAVLGPLLLLQPAAQLVTALPATQALDRIPAAADTGRLIHRPNVYWFVLDGMAGPEYLERIGVDARPFVDGLREQGFTVVDDAHSNYPLTHLAIASALEMDYLYDGVDEPSAGPYLDVLQGSNRTVDRFLANGYRYAHAYPGLWAGSRCSGREQLCLGKHGRLTDTQWALAYATPLIEVVVDGDARQDAARTNDPLDTVEALLDAAPEAPYFAFVHLLNPHPPYLRDAECRLRDVPLDLAAWGLGAEYADAVTCLVDRLSATVDRILAVDEDPVIVIQGDHGPRLGLSGTTTGARMLEGEMFSSILSAIRLPAACRDAPIPAGTTLVNTFRIVFACLEDREPDLLPDRVQPIRRDY